MLRFAAATVMVFAGLAAWSAPAAAAPRNSDCVNCEPAQQPDGSGSATAYTKAAQSMPPADNASEPNPADAGAPAATTPPRECADCAPRKHYDEIEVIKNTRDVDQSRTINTKSEVVVPPRVREHNKLIIHENETRNVGVIQHNHQIVEKEIRYVRRAPARPRAVLVYRPQPVLVPVIQQQSSGCGCGGSTLSYGYRVGYVYKPEYVRPLAPQVAPQVAQYAVMPAAMPTVYGYR
jgi:hypothetical protein